MTKIFCICCGIPQPLLIDPMSKDDLNGEKIWGDLVCAVCTLVIASLEVDQEGEYEFRIKE